MKKKETAPKAKPAASIGWEAAHRRVEIAEAALAREWSPSPERKKEILRQRARLLSREAKPGPEAGCIEVLEFLLAGERYAVESCFVREALFLKELTPLPCTPAFVLGIVSVRGTVVSVIDMKTFFDLPKKGLGDLNKMIILSSPEMEFGILADVILGARRVPLDGLQPPPSTFTELRLEYLRGITADRTAVLDAGKILSDKRIIVNEFA